MMCHTASDMGERIFSVGGSSNGHMVKYVQYTGRAAHAGSSPHLGVNALNAANLALAAINSNREGFQEQETARTHGIIVKGGEVVSAVPSDVKLEWRVRSSTPDGLVKNNAAVDRCFKAGALAVGAMVKITSIPGYLAMLNEPTLQELFQSNATRVFGPGQGAGYAAGQKPGRLHRHGRPEPYYAGMSSLYRGGHRSWPQQGLFHQRLRASGRWPGEDNGYGDY